VLPAAISGDLLATTYEPHTILITAPLPLIICHSHVWHN
jgi:hypothetical protein